MTEDAVDCQRTIAKEAAKFAHAKSKALAKCEFTKVKGKHSDPCPNPGGLEGQPGRVAADKIAKAIVKFHDKLDTKCGGDNKLCDGDVSEEIPAALGFPANCWNFESSATPECSDPITHCGDIANCLECINETAVDQAIALTFPADGNIADPVTAKGLNKCQQEIGKVADKFLRAKSKALQKCWDQRLKGLHAASCPDPGLGDGKAVAAIAKAESKTAAAICKKCGGDDKLCGGAGEDADFTPADIGFAASCPAVTVPFGGPACGGSVSTLQELVDCVLCVEEFKVDCIDSARVPEFVPYPCECNP